MRKFRPTSLNNYIMMGFEDALCLSLSLRLRHKASSKPVMHIVRYMHFRERKQVRS